MGQIEEGIDCAGRGAGYVDKTGERFYEAELYRLKGELTLQQVHSLKVLKLSKSPAPNP